ncbi:hypothetical protein EV359DRAFT_65791 [Lentinula novae-zelandiae]|nr:hypothetical protein EV359DRAFT_65791 [Lentinula novae-zelandiae]
MPPKSLLRELFWTDMRPASSSDNVHQKMLCIACIDVQVRHLEVADMLAAVHAHSSQVVVRTAEERLNQSCCDLWGTESERRSEFLKMCAHVMNWAAFERSREGKQLSKKKRKSVLNNPTSMHTLSNENALPVPSSPTCFPASQQVPLSAHTLGSLTTFPFSSLYTQQQPELRLPLSPLSLSLSPLNTEPLQKRQRTGLVPQTWSSNIQEEFGHDLAEVFASCGIAWVVAQHPQFRTFFQKWLPDAHIPDRRVLAGRLLSDLANGVILETREKVNGKLGTYQADGWKNVAKTNVNTSLITVEGKSHLVKTHDMTGRPKTGDEYYSIMEEDIKYIKKVYGVDVICVCTDDGPDGKKARRLVREKQPTIATTQCWSHQMGLSTGDYLKLKLPFMLAASQAIEVIKWWNNYNKAHDLLKAQQLTISMKVLQLILPVITRWTAHYCSLRRVEHLERAIRGCVGAHFEQLLLAGGNRAEEVMAYCQSPVFWLNLKQ